MEFDSNDALMRWMEHEGLSPFTLLKISPKPTATGKKLPASVSMEWGVEDLEYEGDRQRFSAWSITAADVIAYRVEGALDRFEECHAELHEGSGIDVRLDAGGTLWLRCGRLVVGDDAVERLRKSRPRPHHGEFHMELDFSSTTLGELRGWLGIPDELVCLRHRTTDVLTADSKVSDAAHAHFVDAAEHSQLWLSVNGKRLTISRGKWAEDVLWELVWSRIRSVPGVTRISSRNLVSPPNVWPSQPPRKPLPEVWPYVFSVKCELMGLTLGALQAVLELPATSAFVFERADALDPCPDLNLTDAARHEGSSTSGVFRDARGKPLVHCRVDVRESKLVFRREKACDDATWLCVWRAPRRLPNVRQCNSRTTQSPPDPWPAEPPAR